MPELDSAVRFCRHHAKPEDCTELCACGHRCIDHQMTSELSAEPGFGTIIHTGSCDVEGCDCAAWEVPLMSRMDQQPNRPVMSEQERTALRERNLRKLTQG